MSKPANTASVAGTVIAEMNIKASDFGTIQPALPSIANGTTGTCTLTVNRKFKPDFILKNGQSKSRIVVSNPDGTNETAGINLVSAVLEAPATGSYAAGNRPRIVLTWSNTSGATHSPVAREYKILQIEILN